MDLSLEFDQREANKSSFAGFVPGLTWPLGILKEEGYGPLGSYTGYIYDKQAEQERTKSINSF